jgi:hypothetical protein
MPQATKLTVLYEWRADGGLRMWSDDVPGLVLSGADPLKVIADVAPAFEVMRPMKPGETVTFTLAAPCAD